ncbi:MAG: hypothetical protein ACYTAN_02765 [Planctomycetota bacterium]|jgi:hypothetical protein
MLHVSKRRLLAAVIAAAAIVLSATLYFTARRVYSPAVVEAAILYELSVLSDCGVAAEGGRINWGGMDWENRTPVIHGYFAFDGIVFTTEDGVSLKAAPAEVSFAKERRSGWAVERPVSPTWRSSLDLAAKDASANMAGLWDIIVSVAPADEEDSPPEFTDVERKPSALHLEIDYGPSKRMAYEAHMSAFAVKDAIDLRPGNTEVPEGWNLAWHRDKMTLEAPTGSQEELARIVESRNSGVIRDSCGEGTGTFAAEWTGAGEKVTFTSEGGWKLSAGVGEKLGIHLPECSFEGVVSSFEMKGGELSRLEGSVQLNAGELSAAVLKGWFESFGATLPPDTELPEHFENVSIAADFRLAEGEILVSAPAGAPGLAWSSVNSETIVLQQDGLSGAAADVMARLRAVRPAAKADEVGGVEEPEEEPSTD